MLRHNGRLVRIETLLALTDPAHAWEHTHGLAALLEAARKLPPVDPWEPPVVRPAGLGGLLWDIYQHQEREQGDDT